MSFDFQIALDYIQSAGLLFLSILLGGVLPFVVLTMLDGWLSSLALQRIITLGGFRFVYLTAWIGVPIHESSHAIAALIGGHRIRRFAPLKLNPRTGQLGVLETTYDEKMWWSKWVGNTIIPVAPLLGGTTVLFLLFRVLSPNFTMLAYTQFSPPSPDHIQTLLAWKLFIQNMQLQVNNFIEQLWHPELFSHWQTYLIGYAMLCVALHMSPSSTDWHNFRKPFIFLLLTLLLGCLTVMPFPNWLPYIQSFLTQVVTWFLPISLFITMIIVIATVPILLVTQLSTSTRTRT